MGGLFNNIHIMYMNIMGSMESNDDQNIRWGHLSKIYTAVGVGCGYVYIRLGGEKLRE